MQNQQTNLVKNHLLYCTSYRKLTFSKPHIEKLVTSMVTSCLNDCSQSKRWIRAWGMLFHSSSNAVLSWSTDSGCCGRLRTRLSSSSHKCSIGDKSGDNAGHGRTLMLFCARNWLHMRATWHLAWSCWKVWRFLWRAMNGWKISSW